jgi:probable phosphoglycerate mutase
MPDANPDRRLRELHFGELEGARWEECAPMIRDHLVRFDGFQAPGGESVDQLRSRVLDYVAALPEGDHLVFTHGGVIRLLLREIGTDHAVPPGSVTTLTWPA